MSTHKVQLNLPNLSRNSEVNLFTWILSLPILRIHPIYMIRHRQQKKKVDQGWPLDFHRTYLRHKGHTRGIINLKPNQRAQKNLRKLIQAPPKGPHIDPKNKVKSPKNHIRVKLLFKMHSKPKLLRHKNYKHLSNSQPITMLPSLTQVWLHMEHKSDLDMPQINLIWAPWTECQIQNMWPEIPITLSGAQCPPFPTSVHFRSSQLCVVETRSALWVWIGKSCMNHKTIFKSNRLRTFSRYLT